MLQKERMRSFPPTYSGVGVGRERRVARYTLSSFSLFYAVPCVNSPIILYTPALLQSASLVWSVSQNLEASVCQDGQETAPS